MDAPKLKVLLVDDSTTVLIMEEVLLRRKYDVLKATSGAAALKIAADQRPDVILLDVVMPAMDGIEVCRLMRGLPATRFTPIIMVSTRGEMATVQAALASGATGFVTKPIDAHQLTSKIEHYLGRAP